MIPLSLILSKSKRLIQRRHEFKRRLRIKTDRLKLPEIRKQRSTSKLRVVTTSNSTPTNRTRELALQTAQMITKLRSLRI